MARRNGLLSWFYKGRKLNPMRVTGLLVVLLAVGFLLMQLQSAGYLKTQLGGYDGSIPGTNLPSGSGVGGLTGGRINVGRYGIPPGMSLAEYEDDLFKLFPNDGPYVSDSQLSKMLDNFKSEISIPADRLDDLNAIAQERQRLADIARAREAAAARGRLLRCASRVGTVASIVLPMQGCQVIPKLCPTGKLGDFLLELEKQSSEDQEGYEERLCPVLFHPSACPIQDFCTYAPGQLGDKTGNIIDDIEKQNPGCEWLSPDSLWPKDLAAPVTTTSKGKIKELWLKTFKDRLVNTCRAPVLPLNPPLKIVEPEGDGVVCADQKYDGACACGDGVCQIEYDPATGAPGGEYDPNTGTNNCPQDCSATNGAPGAEIDDALGARAPSSGFSLFDWVTGLFN